MKFTCIEFSLDRCEWRCGVQPNTQSDQHLVPCIRRTHNRSDRTMGKQRRRKYNGAVHSLHTKWVLDFGFRSSTASGAAAAAPNTVDETEAKQRRFTFSGEQRTHTHTLTHACLMRSRLLIFDFFILRFCCTKGMARKESNLLLFNNSHGLTALCGLNILFNIATIVHAQHIRDVKSMPMTSVL